MSTLTLSVQAHNVQANAAPKSFSIHTLLATLFAVNLREKLDAATSGDKSDAAYTWGM